MRKIISDDGTVQSVDLGSQSVSTDLSSDEECAVLAAHYESDAAGELEKNVGCTKTGDLFALARPSLKKSNAPVRMREPDGLSNGMVMVATR